MTIRSLEMQNQRLKTLRSNQPIGVKAAEVLRKKLLRKTSLTLTSDDDDDGGSLVGDESVDRDWYETNKHMVQVTLFTTRNRPNTGL